jgi:ABC-type iron transport system FetAB permease component
MGVQFYPLAGKSLTFDVKVTDINHWLQNGEVIPLTTNAIGNAFSRVNNRIKRVGRRWSETGLLNWLKVTFYKIFKP